MTPRAAPFSLTWIEDPGRLQACSSAAHVRRGCPRHDRIAHQRFVAVLWLAIHHAQSPTSPAMRASWTGMCPDLIRQ